MQTKPANKPFIGITTVQDTVDSGGFDKPIITINQSYVDLVSDFGGAPILITRDPDRVAELLDGLLLIGGQDIDPALWGADQKVRYEKIAGIGKPFVRPPDYAPNRVRDDFELSCYQNAKVKKIPILGICRGLQLINIAEGGTLYEEMPQTQVQHESNQEGWTASHFINIEPYSKVYSLMQEERYVTSSKHHQSIDKLGKNLKISAKADDGTIEMIEWEDNSQWVIAVQGHLEQTRKNLTAYDNIIADFIKVASADK